MQHSVRVFAGVRPVLERIGAERLMSADEVNRFVPDALRDLELQTTAGPRTLTAAELREREAIRRRLEHHLGSETDSFLFCVYEQARRDESDAATPVADTTDSFVCVECDRVLPAVRLAFDTDPEHYLGVYIECEPAVIGARQRPAWAGREVA